MNPLPLRERVHGVSRPGEGSLFAQDFHDCRQYTVGVAKYFVVPESDQPYFPAPFQAATRFFARVSWAAVSWRFIAGTMRLAAVLPLRAASANHL